MQLPQVTIIIAHHNYQMYLSHAIQSVLDQDFPINNLKMCIVDDGSDDFESVLKIVEDKLGHITQKNEIIKPHIGIINVSLFTGGHTLLKLSKSCGPSYARNVGIEKHWNDTDIFGILDADDAMYPTKTMRMVETFLISPNDIGVVYADYHILNTITNNIIYEYKEPYDKIRLNEECIVHSGAFISKIALHKTVEETGFYDIHMRTCEDYDLWIRISEHMMIMHIPEPLSLVRVQPRNSSVTVDKSIWHQNWQRIRDKAAQRNAQQNQ